VQLNPGILTLENRPDPRIWDPEIAVPKHKEIMFFCW